MAITLPKERKQKYLILILIFLILVSLIILIKGFWLRPKIEKPEEKEILKPPLIEIDFEVLKSPILKELQPFEEIPAFGEEIGRENPFSPY